MQLFITNAYVVHSSYCHYISVHKCYTKMRKSMRIKSKWINKICSYIYWSFQFNLFIHLSSIVIIDKLFSFFRLKNLFKFRSRLNAIHNTYFNIHNDSEINNLYADTASIGLSSFAQWHLIFWIEFQMANYKWTVHSTLIKSVHDWFLVKICVILCVAHTLQSAGNVGFIRHIADEIIILYNK